MKILYIEDDPRDADLTIRMLSRTAPHLHLESVSTIEKARQRLGRLSPALAFDGVENLAVPIFGQARG